ncbi:MAG: hypothetical protein PWQ55_378 [Chloroflexota bacterium]|nr:hypothetical protein [Chloroflexota bacterium]
MITKSRQVIDFLNNIHEENQLASDEEKKINEMLNADSNQKIKLWDIIQKLDEFPNKFSFPESSTVKPKTVNISYSKPKEQVDLIKKQLQVSSNKEVGEKTFDYFFSSEIEE